MIVGRFAPTPSGRLHLGNIYALLCAWAYARKRNGEMVFRIEDLDVSRCPRKNADILIDDLLWLGLDWDKGPYFQSERTKIYEEYLHKLKNKNAIFPCFCSRGELHAVSAPHLSDGRYRYAGTCRNLTPEQVAVKKIIRPPAFRVKVNDNPINFVDEHYGEKTYILSDDCGDFIVRRSDGVFAYHLAVVIDDALMNVTEIVRGRDLLDSVPVQLYLYDLFGFAKPKYCHIPLLKTSEGKRLAKRDGDLHTGILRQKYLPEDIIGYIAWQVGLIEKREKLSAKEFISVFDVAKLPTKDIILDTSYFDL